MPAITDTIRDIITTYAKHGWTLRRVLLSAATADAVKASPDLFGSAEIVESGTDAAWFSRERQDGGTAWEIRYLGPTQYALVTIIENDDSWSDEFVRLETELAAAVSRQPSNN